MIIPKRFKLFGRYFTVNIDNDYCEDNGALGLCEARKESISLTTKFAGHNLSKEAIQEVFMHEVGHMILHETNYHDKLKEASIDVEQFVELTSKLWYQAIESIKDEKCYKEYST